MNIKIQPCSTVGNAYMVVKNGKFGRLIKLAVGLTKFEAECLKVRKKSEGNKQVKEG